MHNLVALGCIVFFIVVAILIKLSVIQIAAMMGVMGVCMIVYAESYAKTIVRQIATGERKVIE